MKGLMFFHNSLLIGLGNPGPGEENYLGRDTISQREMASLRIIEAYEVSISFSI
jgi:hypothetical protein